MDPDVYKSDKVTQEKVFEEEEISIGKNSDYDL